MKPLEQISLHPRDHKAALWWLGLLYRRPLQFFKQVKSPRITGSAILYLHFFPYMVFFEVTGRLVFFDFFGFESEIPSARDWLHGWVLHALVVLFINISAIFLWLVSFLVMRLMTGSIPRFSWFFMFLPGVIIFGLTFGIVFGHRSHFIYACALFLSWGLLRGIPSLGGSYLLRDTWPLFFFWGYFWSHTKHQAVFRK